MDYKQKYEQALERARNIRFGNPQSGTANIVCEEIFPELKESEDERIRKEIIECLKSNALGYSEQTRNKWFAWLEKQGEQKEINLVKILKHYPEETELYSPLYGRLWLAKVDEKDEIVTCYKYPLDEGCTRAILEQEDTVSFYSNGTTRLPDFGVSKDCLLFLYDNGKQAEQKPTDKVEPKFKVGDIIINEFGFIMQIDGIDGNMYVYHVLDGNILLKHDITRTDESCHLWTIQDAKDGDVLYHKNPLTGIEYIVMSKGINGFGNIDSYFRYNSEDGFDTYIPSVFNAKSDDITPATKEQRDLLFQKMKEAGYEWDAEKKKLKKIEYERTEIKTWMTPASRSTKQCSDYIQQKPAWSEEDEKYYNSALWHIEKSCGKRGNVYDWLKLLRNKLKGE